MGIIETIGDKLGLKGGGDKMQYLLVGVLALVIVIAIVVIISSLTGKKGTGEARDMHYWDVETNQEIVITPEDLKNSKAGPMGPGPGGMMPGGMMGGMMGGGLVVNPNTGERTCLVMRVCPSCKKHYLPQRFEGLTLDDFDEETGMLLGEDGELMMFNPMDNEDNICTKCGTDIPQWRRDNPRKKK